MVCDLNVPQRSPVIPCTHAPRCPLGRGWWCGRRCLAGSQAYRHELDCPGRWSRGGGWAQGWLGSRQAAWKGSLCPRDGLWGRRYLPATPGPKCWESFALFPSPLDLAAVRGCLLPVRSCSGSGTRGCTVSSGSRGVKPSRSPESCGLLPGSLASRALGVWCD